MATLQPKDRVVQYKVTITTKNAYTAKTADVGQGGRYAFERAVSRPETLTPPTLTHTADSCHCEACDPDAARTGQKVAESLANLADVEQMRFFTSHLVTDSETDYSDTLQVTVPLLIKLLEWAREEAKTDIALHKMVELLYEESNSGARVLTSNDYTGDDFKEQLHPRGQPENKGEFAKKGEQQTSLKNPIIQRIALKQHNTQPQAQTQQTTQTQRIPLKQIEPQTGMFSTTVINGKRVQANGKPLPEHIEKARIPPAWTEVEYSNDPNAKTLATGIAANGKKQYVYNEEFKGSQSAIKFARIKELSAVFDTVMQENEANRNSKDARTKDCADAIALITETGIRPGSEDSDNFGLTTLTGKNVIKTNNGVTLDFIGKSNKRNQLPVNDPTNVNMLLQRKAKMGDNGQLFNITDKVLRLYAHTLDGGQFKTKDLRTLLATKTALAAIETMPVPKNETERKKSIMQVAKIVSQKLGNTPAVALQAYISPFVFGPWGG